MASDKAATHVAQCGPHLGVLAALAGICAGGEEQILVYRDRATDRDTVKKAGSSGADEYHGIVEEDQRRGDTRRTSCRSHFPSRCFAFAARLMAGSEHIAFLLAPAPFD